MPELGSLLPVSWGEAQLLPTEAWKEGRGLALSLLGPRGKTGPWPQCLERAGLCWAVPPTLGMWALPPLWHQGPVSCAWRTTWGKSGSSLCLADHLEPGLS